MLMHRGLKLVLINFSPLWLTPIFFSVSLDCGGKSGENLTYLEMAETSTPPHTNCEYTICKCQEKICRIRLDFEVIWGLTHLVPNAYGPWTFGPPQ